LNLPGWYLTAGCVFQTVWNVVTGRRPANGIKDYDLFYFDDSDLSWQAEDRVIDAARSCFADLPVAVGVRNALSAAERCAGLCHVQSSHDHASRCAAGGCPPASSATHHCVGVDP
jgi:hypothetical protein